jgi:glycosyltransferase involved in cell wall biosynthesis
MAEVQRPVKLVHMTTISSSLAFISGQVGYMRARGIDVYAISSPGADLGRFAELERVRVYQVNMSRRITPVEDIGAILHIYQHLRLIHPDIVHTHTPKAGLLGTIAARMAGVPVRIYHIHGLPFMTARGHRRALLRLSETTSSRFAHQVLCVSNSVREVAVGEGFCRADKVKVLGRGSINGVDAEQEFNPALFGANVRAATWMKHGIPADAVVVGFVGRIVRDKGLIELVEAWRLLREEFGNLHLLVVGNPEPQDLVPEDVDKTLRTDPRVHLAGFEWNIPPLYAAMDLVVLPSYREGLPVVPLEAAAMQIPVVATRIPGCVDAVRDGVTGTLVPTRDAQSLASAIRRYIRDPKLARAHGRAGRERMLRDFRPQDIWEATYREYCRLLGEAGISAPTSPYSPCTGTMENP